MQYNFHELSVENILAHTGYFEQQAVKSNGCAIVIAEMPRWLSHLHPFRNSPDRSQWERFGMSNCG